MRMNNKGMRQDSAKVLQFDWAIGRRLRSTSRGPGSHKTEFDSFIVNFCTMAYSEKEHMPYRILRRNRVAWWCGLRYAWFRTLSGLPKQCNLSGRQKVRFYLRPSRSHTNSH